jgi:TonB family protein
MACWVPATAPRWVRTVLLGSVAVAATLGGPRAALAQDSGAVPAGNSGAIVKPPPEEAPKPVIREAELLEFVDATYPPEAAAAGLEANVVLKLTIDREGRVTKVEIPEPVGHGFDEAATEAAMKFRYAPATRDGKPVPAIQRFRYAFKLKAVERAASEAPVTGHLQGRLLLAEGEAPVVGVEIVLVGPDGAERRLRTDAAGRWYAPDMPPGAYHVRIALDGFDPVDSTEDVTAGVETDVTLRLIPQSTGLEVVVQGERPVREVTRRTVERREIDRIPGTGGDALRSLQSLPGVAKSPGGLLIVRGSAPTDTLAFVDGAPIPLIYHFLGLSSVVPTELLDRIDFYPGNFSSRFGRAGAGIVDIALRAPDTRCTDEKGKPDPKRKNDRCVHGLAQIDFFDQRLLAQGPLPFKGWSFIAAGRKSWIDAWLKPVLEESGAGVTTAPVYYDYQVLAEHKTDRSRTSLRLHGADDRVELIINDPFVNDPTLGGSLRFGTAFYRAQLVHENQITSKVNVFASLWAGKDAFSFALGSWRFNLDAFPIGGRYELGFKPFKGLKANAGLDFETAWFDVEVRFPDPPRPGEPDPGPYAARPPRESKNDGFGFRPAWYGELEIDPTDQLHIVPGVRIDYARDTSHADVAPRANARYLIVPAASSEHPDRLKTAIKGGVGIYYQPPQYQETDPIFGTPNLYSNRATHYSLGVEQDLTRNVELGVEGFYKDLTRQVARGPNATGSYSYNNDGTGYVIGGEGLLKYKPDERFFGWIAYTISRSVRRDGPGRPRYLFQFDQTHNLTVLGSYRLGRGWEFGARFSLVSGPLETPTLKDGLPSLYAADAGAYAKLDGIPFSERLPLRHQLDLRLDKRWQLKRVKMSTYLDIQNVYNHSSVEGFVYNYDFSRRGYQTGVPIIPSLGFRLEI